MTIFSFRKRRDRDEFADLVEEHLDGLYRVALRYTREASRAEDLVHDTVVRALRFRDRFEMGTNFRAWIYTILNNTFIHRYRRQQREREILGGASREDVERSLSSHETQLLAEAPEHVYLDNLLSDDVVHALDELPEEFRKVVVLCDIEGLSYREIADVMGCPVGTVMSRLYRGRRLLEGKLVDLAVEQGIVPQPREAATDDRGAVFELKSYRRRRTG